jgi:hypothetical protein
MNLWQTWLCRFVSMNLRQIYWWTIASTYPTNIYSCEHLLLL